MEDTEGIPNGGNAIGGTERTPWVYTKVGIGPQNFEIFAARPGQA